MAIGTHAAGFVVNQNGAAAIAHAVVPVLGPQAEIHILVAVLERLLESSE